jgi:hypothetical protein
MRDRSPMDVDENAMSLYLPSLLSSSSVAWTFSLKGVYRALTTVSLRRDYG